MKTTTFLSLILITSSFWISCNDWLDVSSSEIVLEDDAFKTYKGYRTALLGAYKIVASDDMWGKELTWGFMSIIAKNYNQNPLSYSNLEYEDFQESSIIKNKSAAIWETTYNTIANCNNILINIRDTDDDFFQYPWERNLIIAETKALRALCHFEILRLFIPAPITGYTGRAIPYVTTYPDLNPEYYNLDEILEFVLEDLKESEEILKEIDINNLVDQNAIAKSLFYGYNNLRDDGTTGAGSGFFSFRGYRMNYWGVRALMARIYSYNRQNDKAVEIIDELLSDWQFPGSFNWGQFQYSNNPNEISGKRIPETFIGFWNTNAYTIYENEFIGSPSIYTVSINALFGNETGEDYRYRSLYNSSTRRYDVWARPLNYQYDMTAITDTITTYHGVMLPVLELSELYYIKCEYLAEQSRIDEACDLLRQLRNGRNLTGAVSANDYYSFMRILINDMTREFLTRGQTWHYLKKLNWDEMYDGVSGYWQVPADRYFLPFPDSEVNFY